MHLRARRKQNRIITCQMKSDSVNPCVYARGDSARQRNSDPKRRCGAFGLEHFI